MSDSQFWDERYARPDYLFGTEPNRFLLMQRARLRAGMRALALADGEGRNGVWLAQQGLDVVAVDNSRVALAKAMTLAQSANVEIQFECADLRAWQWPEAAFDAVVAIFIQFADSAERALLHGRIVRALKPGGLLILQGYTRANWNIAPAGLAIPNGFILPTRCGANSRGSKSCTRANTTHRFAKVARIAACRRWSNSSR